MSLSISYGNFNFPDPKPFVQKEQTPINYGGIWGQNTKIILNGVITGASFNQIINNQEYLISGLSKDYQRLTIGEDRDIFNVDIAKLVNIDFNQSKYVGVVDYQVEFQCYESGFFNQTFGILDPVNEYIFEENSNSTINLSHNISAKGFTTSNQINNSLDNAKKFVKNLTGYNESILKPFAIKNDIFYNPILTEYSESIDRINSIYSVKENYLINISQTGENDDAKYLTRYAVNVNEDAENDFKAVSINGEIISDFINSSTSMSELRNYAENLNLKNICESKSNLKLNAKPLNLNFTEDPKTKKITFSADFNTNKLDDLGTGNAYFDYKVNVDFDTINNLSIFSLDGIVTCQGGYTKEKYKKVLDFYSGQMSTGSRGIEGYLFNLTNDFYKKVKNPMSLSSNFLDNTANNLSVTRSPYVGQISISAGFQDRNGLNPDDADTKYIKNITYNISINPIMDIFKPNPTYDVNGKYLVYELGQSKTLEKATILLNIQYSRGVLGADAQDLAKKYFNIIKSNYGYQEYIINNESLSFIKYDKSNDIRSANYQIDLIKKSKSTDEPFIPGKVLLKL
jgi:hypothetical protein